MSFVSQHSAAWRSQLIVVALLLLGAKAITQTVQYKPVPQVVIETRLQKYGGNDAQRETKLKQMVAEAGCVGLHLAEQMVKESKLPNVICKLTGSTDKTIIVGAHFDHVAAGDGVADNWSGASLLPSLYEALKVKPRKHTYIFIGFSDEERGEIGSRFYV